MGICCSSEEDNNKKLDKVEPVEYGEEADEHASAPIFPGANKNSDNSNNNNNTIITEGNFLYNISVKEKIATGVSTLETNYQIILISCKNLGDWVNKGDSVLPQAKQYASLVKRAIEHFFSSELFLLRKLQTVKKFSINASNPQVHDELLAPLRDTLLPPVLLDSVASGMATLGDWLSRSRKCAADPKTTKAEAKTLQFLPHFFREELRGLESSCKKQFKLQVSNVSIQTLRSRHTHRFSARADYGSRSRDSIMERLVVTLSAFYAGTKESCPLIGVVSVPRQGETSFLDSVGENPDIIKAFSGKHSLDDVFVLSISFNAASWKFENTAKDHVAALDAAKYGICLRLLAAAVGICNKSQWNDDGAREKSILNLLTVLQEPKEVIALIKNQIIERTGVKNPKIIVLMDEFSNLEPKIDPNDPLSSLAGDLCRKALYSMMSECVGSDQAIILGVFSPIPCLGTISGRAVESICLDT